MIPAAMLAQQQPAGPSNPNGWVLGEDASTKTNPLPADAATLAIGKGVYKEKCERCHGPGGLGDGKDADPDARGDMDLTNPKRAARNTDGVVYYKVANGRKKPKMPVFKEELKDEQIWAVVAYVQSLRKK
jgi:mono/diheme cytochrome c family protein